MINSFDVNTFIPAFWKNSGRFYSGYYNYKNLEEEVLERILKNVQKYVKNRGTPEYFFGELKVDPIPYLLAGPLVLMFFPYSKKEEESFKYFEGKLNIDSLKSQFRIGETIINIEKGRSSIEENVIAMENKGGILNKLRVRKYKKKILPLWEFLFNCSLSGLIYNLDICDTGDQDFNVEMQPLLRNALAIGEYFKVENFEKESSVDFGFDQNYRETLNIIPKELRIPRL